MTIQQIITTLSAREPLPQLRPEAVYNAELSETILRSKDEELFEGFDPSDEKKGGCRAGLLLWNDDLDASHTVSQSIKAPTGSAWHAMMHRREGDFSNSKHWWRNAGAHPAFDDIYTEAMSALLEFQSEKATAFAEKLHEAGTWIPMEFVDACAGAQEQEQPWLQRLQVVEIRSMLNWCLR